MSSNVELLRSPIQDVKTLSMCLTPLH